MQLSTLLVKFPGVGTIGKSKSRLVQVQLIALLKSRVKCCLFKLLCDGLNFLVDWQLMEIEMGGISGKAKYQEAESSNRNLKG